MTLKISRSQVSTQPNPTHQKFKNSDPTQPNPTHGWTQPMTNSGTDCCFTQLTVCLVSILQQQTFLTSTSARYMYDKRGEQLKSCATQRLLFEGNISVAYCICMPLYTRLKGTRMMSPTLRPPAQADFIRGRGKYFFPNFFTFEFQFLDKMIFSDDL